MEQLTFEQLLKAISQLNDRQKNIERILLQKSNLTIPEANQLLTIKQAGELLGQPVQSNGKRKILRKHCKKSNHKKNKRFPKPGKLIRWLIQVFFVFVLHSMVNNYYAPESPNLLQYTSRLTAKVVKSFSLPCFRSDCIKHYL